MASSPRLRVFVSSVIEGYEQFRAAAAQGIEDAEAEPVMAELLPSLAVSPRNACLDGVGSCDAYIVLVGPRAGWTTPSGALATEEEFDEARRLSRPVLAFVQDVPQREPTAVEFANKISDYVTGGFRKRFTDPADLRSRVAQAVKTLRRSMELPLSDPGRVPTLLLVATDRSYEASVRLVFVPERLGELVPPERLDSEDLVQELYSVGHDRRVRFFDFSASKAPDLSSEGILSIVQRSERGRARNAASISLSESGELILEKDIRQEDQGDSIRAFHSIAEADLKTALGNAFAFAAGIWDLLDPHERYSTLWAGAAILGADNRYLYRDPPMGGSVPVRTGESGPIVAEKKARKVMRSLLRAPQAEIDRLVSLFRRSLAPASAR